MARLRCEHHAYQYEERGLIPAVTTFELCSAVIICTQYAPLRGDLQGPYDSAMLASLLPGLRDLRTPLATGYLWLVALWLLVHQYVPKSVFDASGPIRSLYQLGALAGTTACLAAVSFVAYLVGSMLSFYPRQYILGLVQPRPDPNMRRSSFTRVFNYGRRNILSIQLGYELYYQLETFVSPKLREASETLSEDQLGYLVPGVVGWGLW